MTAACILLAFLAAYYRLMWHCEIGQNDRLHQQKANLYRKMQRYRSYIRHKKIESDAITELKIEKIEND